MVNNRYNDQTNRDQRVSTINMSYMTYNFISGRQLTKPIANLGIRF